MTQPPRPVSITGALSSLTFLPDRTPETTTQDWATAVTAYRDGGMYVAHYAGNSQWERHPADEIVLCVGGSTRLIMLIDDEEVVCPLNAMELLIVPERVWHRFETDDEVKVMSVTPQPTDHQIARPS